MSTEVAAVTAIDEVRSRAAEMVRALVADLRSSRDALGSAEGEGDRLALAAVEAVETLAETTEAMLPILPESARGPLQLAVRSAWEGLESAGIRRDGAVGEPVDLTRHRILKTRPATSVVIGAVCDVIAPGIVFRERRIREAVVCVAGERGDGSRRD